jgi:hypothetical protein
LFIKKNNIFEPDYPRVKKFKIIFDPACSAQEAISELKLDSFDLKSLSTFILFLYLFKIKVEKAR